MISRIELPALEKVKEDLYLELNFSAEMPELLYPGRKPVGTLKKANSIKNKMLHGYLLGPAGINDIVSDIDVLVNDNAGSEITARSVGMVFPGGKGTDGLSQLILNDTDGYDLDGVTVVTTFNNHGSNGLGPISMYAGSDQRAASMAYGFSTKLTTEIAFRIRDSANGSYEVVTTLALGSHTIIGMYNRERLYMYLDGIEIIGPTSTNKIINTGIGEFIFANDQSSTGRYFSGSIEACFVFEGGFTREFCKNLHEDTYKKLLIPA